MTQLQTREEAPQIVRGPAAPARPEPAGGGFTGKDFLRVLRKRKWLILLTLIVITGLFIGGTILWRQLLPGYKAEALVLVRATQPRPEEPDVIGFSNMNPQAQEAMLNTRAREIQTASVLQKAVDDDDVRATTWYSRNRGNALEVLLEKIKVTPAPKSLFIMVSMSGYGDHFKEDLPNIVNAVARHAEAESRVRAVARTEPVKGALQADLDELQRELAAIKNRLRTMQDRGSEMGGYETRAQLLTRAIASLKDRLVEAETEEDRARAAFQQYQGMSLQQLTQTPMVALRVENNPVVYNLRLQADGLEREYRALLTSVGTRSRQVQATRARWDAALDQLAAKQQEVSRREAEALQTEFAQMVADAEQFVDKLNDEIDNNEKRLQDIAGQLTAIRQAELELESKQDQQDRLENTLMQFRLMAGEGRVPSPMVVSQPARTPDEIDSPKYVIMVPLGVFLGLALGVGLAFLLEFTDTSVKSPSDLARRVDLPLLGMVPHLDDIEDSIGDVRMASLTVPNSLISESFRQIRTNVMFSGPSESRKVLLVTSPSPDDGRSTVAVNLAATMTAGGRKVLLVDANFRQPAVGGLFGNCPDGGLSSALVGEGKWEELVAEVEPGLWVMGAGPLPPNPAELLDSEQMRQILTEMSGQFDQVIIDGPPSIVVSDANILAGQSDGVILVVRAGDNTYGLVQRCRDNLERIGAHILGAVLNGVRVSAGGYLRRNYTTFYDYHAQGQLPQK